MVKRILTSKWLRIIVSAVLLYLAFRKVNIVNVFHQLSAVPLWFTTAMVVYTLISAAIGSFRWACLLLEKVTFKDVWNLTEAALTGAFYALFVPSGVAVDAFRWIPLMKKYPDLSKTRLVSSVILDRAVGFTTYITVAWLAVLMGKLMGYDVPNVIFWLFGGIFGAIAVFYGTVYFWPVENLVARLPVVGRVAEVIRLLRRADWKRLLTSYGVSVFSEFGWVVQVWLVNLVIGANVGFLTMLIYMTVIAMILALPMSIAGFGAREQLYLYFFGREGAADDKILAMSTFVGVLAIISALAGGVWRLKLDSYNKNELKVNLPK